MTRARSTALALAVAGAVAALAGASRAQVFVPGDLNGDGEFDVVDSAVQRRALVPLPPGITQACVALPGDVNADAAFDALDASVVRNALAGLGPGFSQTCADPDGDDDGFAPADGDCDDTNPFVNPAAYDFTGNGLDDDCEDGVDTPRASCDSGLPSDAGSALSYALALDLCETAVESPPANARTWGVIGAALSLASGTGTANPASSSIRALFGSGNPARFGSALAVLSTGHAAAPGQTSPSHAAFQPGTSLGSTSLLPSDWLAANGGSAPAFPGCPAPADGVQGKDSVLLRLRIRVPSNARSFRVAAKHFNSDYPEYVCSPYNDYFVVLLDSGYAGAMPNPADANLATAGGLEIGANLATTASGLFTDCVSGPTGCAPDATAGSHAGCTGTAGLTATGMDVANPPGVDEGVPGWCAPSHRAGGATPWLAIRGNVVPGETIELRFAVWDTSDGFYDSFVLLDDFRWSPTEVAPGATAD